MSTTETQTPETAVLEIAREPTADESAFALVQRQAQALASSDLVPDTYRGNTPNCMLALELAKRTNSSAFMVMQNVHIIHGRPSWSATFIIAAINSCGRFSPLRFTLEGTGMDRCCVASAKDLSDGFLLEGPPVSMEMAQAEGWLTKKGSKWKTMPELMLRYRSAAFFGRLYAPDVLMGMHMQDEVEDFAAPSVPAGAAALESIRDITPPPDPIDQGSVEDTPAMYSKDAAAGESDAPLSSPALADEPPEDWEEPKRM